MSVDLTIESPTYVKYPVKGATLEDILACIQRKGPKDEHDGEKVAALTTTRVDFIGTSATTETVGQPTAKPNGRYSVKVRLKNLALVHSAEILYPECTSLSKLSSKAARAEWKRFMNCLMTHEMEHVKLSARMAEEIREALANMTAEAEALEAAEAKAQAETNLGLKLNHAFENVLKKTLSQVHKKLDTSTHHGERDGAVLDTSIV